MKHINSIGNIRIFICLFFIQQSISAQTNNSVRYGKDTIFQANEVIQIENIKYASALNRDGVVQDLYLDVYLPDTLTDTVTSLPLILLAHGGSYRNGDKDSLNYLCTVLAQRGYAVATMNYRLGWYKKQGCTGDPVDFLRAFYRSVQDANAALRFLVYNAATYHIDTSKIFIGGISSGSTTMLHTAFASDDELSALTDATYLGLGSPDNSGNTINATYTIKGVLNDKGGTLDSNIIDSNENIPVISFHGTHDSIVPFDTGALFTCYQPVEYHKIYGSNFITSRLEQYNIPFELNFLPGGGHTDSTYSNDYVAERCSIFFGEIMNQNITSIRHTYALYIDSINSINTGCDTDFTSQVIIYASGGTAPLLYSLNGIDYQPSNILNLINDGEYTIYVRDGLMNTINKNIVIYKPSYSAVDSIKIANAYCNGNPDGSIRIYANDASITYSLDGINFTDAPEFSNLDKGIYSVEIKNDAGCITKTDSVEIDYNFTLNSTLTTSGPSQFCEGENIIIDAGEGYSAYNWNTGAAAQSITINNAGNYFATLLDENGCIGYSDTVAVSFYSPPQISISASGTTTFCKGGSVLLSALHNGSSVQWKKNGINIPGAANNTYIATSKGTYTCEVIAECGNATSNVISVTVQNSPEAVITADAPITFCDGGNVTLTANTGGGMSYKWYRGNKAIAGATALSYTATKAGVYKCLVTKNASGCSKYSNTITVSVTCREGEEMNNDITIFPNPANENIFIQGVWSNNEKINISILNIRGELLQTTAVNVAGYFINEKINLTSFSPGIYFIKLTGTTQEKEIQFVKNN